MKGLVLDAKWEPRAEYQVTEWEQKTGKAITGSSIWRYPSLGVREWPDPAPGPKEVVLEVQACAGCAVPTCTSMRPTRMTISSIRA